MSIKMNPYHKAMGTKKSLLLLTLVQYSCQWKNTLRQSKGNSVY